MGAMQSCAGGESRGGAVRQIPGDMKLGSPLGGLHALIRQRTAALGTCGDSSSNGTGWDD